MLLSHCLQWAHLLLSGDADEIAQIIRCGPSRSFVMSRKVGHSSLWSWPCCCNECAPWLPNSKVVPAFLIWFSALSIGTPLGRVPPVTPAISASQGAVCGVLLMGTSMWSPALIQFNNYLLRACRWLRNTQGATGEKEKQGHFPPSRGFQYYCLPTKIHLTIREDRQEVLWEVRVSFSGPQPPDFFCKKICNHELLFCVCILKAPTSAQGSSPWVTVSRAVNDIQSC